MRRLLVLLMASLMLLTMAACGTATSKAKPKAAAVDMGETIPGLTVSGRFSPAASSSTAPGTRA